MYTHSPPVHLFSLVSLALIPFLNPFPSFPRPWFPASSFDGAEHNSARMHAVEVHTHTSIAKSACGCRPRARRTFCSGTVAFIGPALERAPLSDFTPFFGSNDWSRLLRSLFRRTIGILLPAVSLFQRETRRVGYSSKLLDVNLEETV